MRSDIDIKRRLRFWQKPCLNCTEQENKKTAVDSKLEAATTTGCYNHRLLQPLAATTTHCYNHRLLQPQAATTTGCYNHRLLQPLAATTTHCYNHRLLQPLAAHVRTSQYCLSPNVSWISSSKCSMRKDLRNSTGLYHSNHNEGTLKMVKQNTMHCNGYKC
jgi:hypothetical protein